MELWADWERHHAAPVESYKYLCVIDQGGLCLCFLQNALALLDLYSQVSLSL